MSTILMHFEPEKFIDLKPIASIRGAKTNTAAYRFLQAIDEVAPINRSWVGTSKFLHFLNPEIFPIWDSRVARRSFKNLKLHWSKLTPRARGRVLWRK